MCALHGNGFGRIDKGRRDVLLGREDRKLLIGVDIRHLVHDHLLGLLVQEEPLVGGGGRPRFVQPSNPGLAASRSAWSSPSPELSPPRSSRERSRPPARRSRPPKTPTPST